MTAADASRTVAAHGAVFKSRMGTVDWYWSEQQQAWIAWQHGANGEVTLRKVPKAQGCGC